MSEQLVLLPKPLAQLISMQAPLTATRAILDTRNVFARFCIHFNGVPNFHKLRTVHH